ncbi:hypothetical protein BRD00_05705 [Halobacteriales archaeon QS_8_69_26]|nr:MAG: hypothetical protein BRD00_05705 [Halobacteriales archaeon QS_8_69_26]
MPHQCTNCNRTFPDGSKEMLSGCPDCGGNKFRYRPSGDAGEPEPSRDRPEPAPDPDPGGSVTDAVRGATTTVRDWVGRGGADGSRAPDRGDRPSGPVGSPGTAEGDPASEPDPSSEPAVGRGWEDVPESGESPGSSGDGGSAPDPDEGSVSGPEEGSVPSENDGPPPGTPRGPVPDDAERVDDGTPTPDGEDTAQASARASMVEPDELPDPSGDPPSGVPSTPSGSVQPDPGEPDPGGDPDGVDAHGPAAPGEEATPGPADGSSAATGGSPEQATGPPESAHDGDSPDLSKLRQELNDQFESIKIVEPGQYELNLMELYDREEYIISLMEDGRYAIEVPETWRDDGF